jgi:hypothetical protein
MVGADSLAWTSASTPTNQKSLRRISHRQWTRPRKASNIYISETIDLWGKDEGQKAEINSLVSIPSLLESTVDRVPVVFFSIAGLSTANGNRRAVEGKRNSDNNSNNHKSRPRTEELENQQSIEQASYETKRDAILTNNFLLCVSRLSSNMTFLSSKRTHLIDWRNTSWTPHKLRELKHSARCAQAREEYIQACLDKTDCKKHRLSGILCTGPHLQRSDYSVRNWPSGSTEDVEMNIF